MKEILDLTRVQLIPNQNAMVVRGTTDQMILAEKLLTDIDKSKAEVVVDIAVMLVNRDHVRNLGTNPPTSASIVMGNHDKQWFEQQHWRQRLVHTDRLETSPRTIFR
jgi:glucan biosynthesis protein